MELKIFKRRAEPAKQRGPEHATLKKACTKALKGKSREELLDHIASLELKHRQLLIDHVSISGLSVEKNIEEIARQYRQSPDSMGGKGAGQHITDAGAGIGEAKKILRNLKNDPAHPEFDKQFEEIKNHYRRVRGLLERVLEASEAGKR